MVKIVYCVAVFCFLFFFLSFLNDEGSEKNKKRVKDFVVQKEETYKVIHILVALCDNEFQGIVPVPKAIGNGKKPSTNLYWGCGYGVKTFFKKSMNWDFLKVEKDSTNGILERLVFKHKDKRYYLIADAYDGEKIKECSIDFLKSCSGELKKNIFVDDIHLDLNGGADLLVYVGHNGLMDFILDMKFAQKDEKERKCMIFACYSKLFFEPYLKNTRTKCLLWTKGLMCPEAYTIHAAIGEYCNGDYEGILKESIKTYSKYQKCSLKGAGKIFSSG